MKKLLPRFLASCILIIALLLPARADAASASLTGSTSGLRPGSTVTLTLSVSGNNLVAVVGTFSNMQGMSLQRVTSARSSWTVTMEGNTFNIYDSSMSSPISGTAAVINAVFTVNSDIAAGSTVKAAVSSLSATDGANTLHPGSPSWSATIAAPLSSNNNLSSLSCSNASLSPAFSAGTTYYSLTVPYSVTALNLNYTKADSTSSVTVSGNSLVVGSNTVTITVTAQNGAKKSYYITATRQQDPNYKPSANALLQSLTPSAGTLSPAFDPDVTEYVIYLPYEAESFSLSGVAQDGKARSVTDDSATLEEGDNELCITCTAEDAVTTKTYTVHVYRMPLYAGELPEIIAPDTTPEKNEPEPESEPEVESEPTLWEKSRALVQTGVIIPYVSDYTGELPLWGLAAAALVLLVLLFYLLGTLAGKAVGRRKTLRRLQEAENAPAIDEEFSGGETEPAAQSGEPPADETPAADAPAPAEETAPASPAAPADDPIDAISLDDILKDVKNM